MANLGIEDTRRITTDSFKYQKYGIFEYNVLSQKMHKELSLSKFTRDAQGTRIRSNLPSLHKETIIFGLA